MSNKNFFDNLTKLIVWDKGFPIVGYSPTTYRKDRFGAVMKFSDYGNTNSNYGWEIDHIFPVAKGGIDNISNLEPLNWKSNRFKSDKLI